MNLEACAGFSIHHLDLPFLVEAFGTQRCNSFMRGIYGEDAWIPQERAAKLASDLNYFVKAYVYSARLYRDRCKGFAFGLYPKLHALHEVAFELSRQASLGWAMNPAVEICGPDEDFVGRIAHLSRCVSPRLIPLRCIQRYLAQIQVAWGRV